MKMKKGSLRKNLALLLSMGLVLVNLEVSGLAALAWGMPGTEREAGSEWSSASNAGQNAGKASGSDAAGEEELINDLEGAATPSNLLLRAATGDLWEHWTATDYKFLDGNSGKGTAKQPYQIRTKAHLMAFSQLASLGMVISPGALESDAYVGDYDGAYFELMADINLAGMDWIPIGFYQNEAEMKGMVPHPFRGHFDGNGHTISNYRISKPDWDYAGLFGAVEDGSIRNLHVRISDTLTAGSQVGILAGYVEGQSVIQNCSVKGNVRGKGLVGGLVGYAAGSGRDDAVIEDCKADVTVDAVPSDSGRQVSAGGIAGQADSITIVDCEVETADNRTARIQGKGYVGGITGWQNDTDIYHVLVSSGTIGGNGATAIGGITGYYTSGDIKVARVHASIGSSGLGNYAHEGVFIGNKGSGCNFTYGTSAQDDLAYLFTDTEAKLNAGVCGSDVPDDNAYTYDAHVGFWHAGDLYFTWKQGNRTKVCTDRYFYEELEAGILNVMDEEINGGEVPFVINHVAPDSTGRPRRGYLISIPQIDTVANGTNFYDVAVLTVTGNGAYYRPLDKEHRGAVADGATVTIATSPRNTDTEKYQLSGAPQYVKGGASKAATYVTGGEYTFTMPANDTEVTAVYKRVAADIRVAPTAYGFKVVQTRTGNRKAPTLTTVVTGNTGHEIARYVNGTLTSAQVMPVSIQKTVDTNDDVADSRVLWSVDDPGLIRLLENDDKDAAGYTDKSASIQVRLDSPFFTDIIRNAESRQAENGYRYAIPATIYGAGHAGGGVAVLTAATRNSESFEGKPCTAQCRVNVTFQILDQTYVDIETVDLDQKLLEYVVTRTLTGNRKAPAESITVTPPQILRGNFHPEYFSRKDVTWSVDDPSIASIAADADSYQSVRVSAISQAKWIQDLIDIDRNIKAQDPMTQVAGSGTRETRVVVKADDRNGNSRTAFCTVRVTFVTNDHTGKGSSSGSSGSSGGSGGSGGGGGSSSGVTPVGTTKRTDAPAGAVTGTWVQDGAGHWLFTGEGRTYASEWAYIHNPYAPQGQERADWYRFDDQGYMVTGWFTDAGGDTYYLHDVPDGTQGRMYTGWHWIGGKQYYFKEVSDGTRGALQQDAAAPDSGQAESASARGYWSDTDHLTWTRSDGSVVVIGNGPRYADLHPEVTDREALLKEYVNNPGDGVANQNSKGEPKANYEEGALQLLREFVNSFDWIHSDELTRLKAVHDRIALGRHGNTYGSSNASRGAWRVLQYKEGVCSDYAWEFQQLANYVGLECVTYEPEVFHAACLVKINGQWITVDAQMPNALFDNTVTYPVDFDVEYNRKANEYSQSESGRRMDAWALLNEQLQQGVISEEEFNEKTEELWH